MFDEYGTEDGDGVGCQKWREEGEFWWMQEAGSSHQRNLSRLRERSRSPPLERARREQGDLFSGPFREPR